MQATSFCMELQLFPWTVEIPTLGHVLPSFSAWHQTLRRRGKLLEMCLLRLVCPCVTVIQWALEGLNIKLGVEHSRFAAGHCAFLFVEPSSHFVSLLWLLILNFNLCIMCMLFISVSFQWFFHRTSTFVIFCSSVTFSLLFKNLNLYMYMYAVVTSLSPSMHSIWFTLLSLVLRTVKLQCLIGLYFFNFAFILIGSVTQSCNNKI